MIALLVFSASIALAEDDPFVLLELEDPALAELVARDLAAGLRDTGLAVQREPGSTPPLAIVAVSIDAAVRIEVRDGVTDKVLAREIDLSDLPERARPLAIAVAAEELLRASWAEIALVREEARPAPPVVERAVARSIRRDIVPEPSSVQHRLRIAGAGRYYSDDAWTIGGELLYTIAFRRLGLGVGFEGAGVLSASDRLGTVGATVLAIAALVQIELLDPAALQLDLALRASGGVVIARGDPTPPALGATDALALVTIELVVAPSIRLAGPLALVLELGGGVALLGASLDSADGALVGLSGVFANARLGLSLEL